MSSFSPQYLSDSNQSSQISELGQAFLDGLLILMRLGLAAALGFALLYVRTGKSPRKSGVTRNGQPLADLVKQGLILGLFSSFIISVLFQMHAIVPLGDGLPAWWTYGNNEINVAFLLSVLGTSVLIPPLTEELLFRGYARTRMVESYGVISGVILTGLVFGLSHSRYIANDAMLLLFLTSLLISSVMWTHVAQKTGSVIPPMIGHAISNAVGTAILFNTMIPFLLATIAVFVFRKEVFGLWQGLVSDWRHDPAKKNLWQGLAIVFVLMAIVLLSITQVGRTTTLIALGLLCLVYTIAFTIIEKRGS